MKLNAFVFIILIIACCNESTAQQKVKSATQPPGLSWPPGLSSITLAELKKDLYEHADPHFKGRSAGTIDELKAGAWLAKKMREAGLEPAGDDGTYFQFFSLWRNRIAPTSSVMIGGKSLSIWGDVLISQIAPATVSAPVIFIGDANSATAEKADVKGKVVAVTAVSEGISHNVSLPEWRYTRQIMLKYGDALLTRGAVGIIFIADEYMEHAWPYAKANFVRGSYDIEGGPNVIIAARPPVIWLHRSALDWIKSDGLNASISIQLERFTYPSVNIIGKAPGKDPILSNEYVVLSGHPDAHGIRNVIGNDSIYHGADDNASVNVAMLAVARALKKNPGKRSALIVIHGAEERGLLGSRWFTAHPTVPLASMVAVLNGDMIGRNTPDSAALLGVQPPHRNSMDLVNMALAANNEGPKFKLDTLWDKTTHKEGWYFRSDHLPYARLGVPALMYSTLLHPDYHTPQDNAQNIDYEKLLKMTQWIYRTARKVVDTDKRPAPEPGFKLER